MASLPLLVSLLISDERNKNAEAEGLEDAARTSVEQTDHRIDFPTEDSRDSTQETSEKQDGMSPLTPSSKRFRRFDSISAASNIVKQPYSLFRRILHALHQFIFVPDKNLEEGYAPKYRYWPIVSGCIVPFSILLEVPGLTEHWYVRTYGTQVVEYRPNPMILNVGLALSMASAVMANLCLLMRFLERRIRSATIATICFLAIHDIINITALAIFGIVHRFDDGFTYSQAYWVTFASTIASLTVTITLLIDFFRTSNFNKSGSGLTRKQRSLVIIVMLLLTYLGFGALVYCFILKVGFLDALYFAVCSSLTIGFGDIVPMGSGAQVFSIFYNTFGILNTGLAIAIARETIVESFQQSYRNRRHALALRRKLHRQAHAKHHQAKHGLWLAGHKFNSRMPSELELPISSTPPTPPPEVSTPSARRADLELYEGETEANTHIEGTKEGTDATGKPVPWRKPSVISARSAQSVQSAISVAAEDQEAKDAVQDKAEETDRQVEKVDDNLVVGFDDEEQEYIQFRKDMIHEENKEFKAKLWVSWGLFFIFWSLGGVIFMLTEKWSYGTSVYFCFTAFSTIGYGDVAPRTGPGRVCFIAWSLLGVGTMTILVSVLSEAYQSRYSTVMHNGLFDKAIRNYQNKTQGTKQSSQPNTPTYDKETMTIEERRNALDETKVEMASLPPKIIAQTKVFHAHLQYVLSHNSSEKPPPGLQRALDDMIEEENMNEQLRKEVLEDEEARKTLFMMSFERSLKKMVEQAERMSKLIQERDSLEEGLGFKEYQEELQDKDDDKEYLGRNCDDGDDRDGDDDDVEGERPPLRHEGSKGPTKSHLNWLKLRAGVLGPFSPRHTPGRKSTMPYLHESGSQSEPRFSTDGNQEQQEQREEDGSANSPSSSKNKDKGKGPVKSRWNDVLPAVRAPSKLSNVRFADDPYGDLHTPE